MADTQKWQIGKNGRYAKMADTQKWQILKNGRNDVPDWLSVIVFFLFFVENEFPFRFIS